MNVFLFAVSAALVNNVVLSQFLGLCPFLGVSKKTNTVSIVGISRLSYVTYFEFDNDKPVELCYSFPKGRQIFHIYNCYMLSHTFL